MKKPRSVSLPARPAAWASRWWDNEHEDYEHERLRLGVANGCPFLILILLTTNNRGRASLVCTAPKENAKTTQQALSQGARSSGRDQSVSSEVGRRSPHQISES